MAATKINDNEELAMFTSLWIRSLSFTTDKPQSFFCPLTAIEIILVSKYGVNDSRKQRIVWDLASSQYAIKLKYGYGR
jgi:hypothetical protein